MYNHLLFRYQKESQSKQLVSKLSEYIRHLYESPKHKTCKKHSLLSLFHLLNKSSLDFDMSQRRFHPFLIAKNVKYIGLNGGGLTLLRFLIMKCIVIWGSLSFSLSLMLNAKLFWEIQLIYRRLFQVTTKIPYVTCCCADKSKFFSEKWGA